MVSVKQMYDYLKIASKLEEDVYTNKQVLKKIGNRIDELNSVDYYTEDNYRADIVKSRVKAKQNKSTSRIIKTIIIIFVLFAVLFFGINLFLAIITGSNNNGEMGLTAGTIAVIIVSVLPWVAIISVILIIIKKHSRNTKNEYALVNETAKSMLEKSNAEYEKNYALLLNYNKQYDDMKTVTIKSINSLSALYNENILPAQYRNIAAVTTMYQWLKSGRCTEIYGHGGVFDTYENDLKMNMIIGRLDEISFKLDVIASNQEMLYQEIKRGNEIAEKTYQSVKQIEYNSDYIVRDLNRINTNTEILARNSEQSMWMQQYAYYKSLYY